MYKCFFNKYIEPLVVRFGTEKCRRALIRDKKWLIRAATHITDSPYSLEELKSLQCIFFHIPKTGGLSISKTLFGNRGLGHINTREAKILFGSKNFKKYFKFTFVRNPWDRLISSYEYLKSGGLNGKYKNEVYKKISQFDSFKDFAKRFHNTDIIKDIHFLPQYYFVCNKKSRVEVDFVGKYERINEDFKLVTQKVNVPCHLLHLNQSTRKDYKSYYDNETKKIVSKIYHKDIEIFNYKY